MLGSLLSLGASAQTALPTGALPTGGQLSAGQASISQSGANMLIQQGSNRAVINWQSFNVGSNAQVQFQQPGASSVTLNRVMSSDPSQIFGRITANGQVILTNPQGVYFGKDARVDVGGLIATTHGISNADLMAGKNRFERKGSTGSVVNEGELKASLGGYVALLAPEVRNLGAIIARMGTVALAAGEAIDLHFDSNNRLTSIRVEPGQIQALVDNRLAVQAPGGLIILSAQSMDRLVGGVVRNSGRIEANGLQQQGGRILLTASHKVENTGSISANAGVGTAVADSGPAGKIEISAPEVINSGAISALGNALSSAGSVLVQATNFTQTASGSVDLSAPQQGGALSIQATGQVQLQGQVNASATQDAQSYGGQIDIAAQGDIHVSDAALDASGAQGGQIQLRAAAPAQSDNPNPLPVVPDAPGQGRLAILGNSTLSTRGRSSKGGLTTLLGEHIELLNATHMDATGATGGGTVLVGGDWQGSNGIYQATSVTMAQSASIDASATVHGDGGKVVLWSDVHKAASVTQVEGRIQAKAAGAGSGGQVETSGHTLRVGNLSVNAQSANGQDGLWLLDPYNITIATAADAGTALASNQFTASASGGVVNATTLQNALASNAVTVSTAGAGSDTGNITLNADLAWSSAKVLTFRADGGVSGSGNIAMTGATGAGVVFNQAGNSSYSGSVSGANAALTKQGAGTLTLTGASNYEGATNVNEGTLKISSTGKIYSTTNSNPWSAITTVSSGAVLELSNWAWGGSMGTRYFEANALVINGGTLRYSGATNTTFDSSNGRGFTVGSSGATFDSATAGANWSLYDYTSSQASYKSVFGGPVTFTGAGDFTVGHVITGSNAVTKTGLGTLTLQGTNTYTGATTISAGTLVLQNNAPANSSSGFSGAGALRIEPLSNDFTSDFSTSGWTFGSTLGGLTIGKTSSADGTSDKAVTIPSAVSIAGPISIYGGAFAPNVNLRSTTAGAAILLQASGSIDTGGSAFSLTTNNGAVSVIADSNAQGSGAIWFGNATINPGSGSVILRAKSIDPEMATINGSGTVTFESSDGGFSGAFNTNRVNLASTLTGLTVGKSTNTQDVTVGSALSIAGPISIYGGNITLNAGLTANGTDTTTNTITLKGSGNVTQTAALSARDLVLSGTVALDQANTISNSTTLQSGTLGVYANTALGSGSLTLGHNTNFLLGRAVTQIANNISLSGAATLGLDSTVDFLLVGGAGGGGTDGGGGGGGGGLYALSTSVGAVSSTAVTVGMGGTGGTYSPYVFSTDGGYSSIAIGGTSYTAGGGVGGGNGPNAAPGGAGGTGTRAGGAGGQASSGGGTVGANGYNGNTSAITGSTVYYGGGGGGGIYLLSGRQTSGGLGGGGAGATWASSSSSSGYSGGANTGGGGGGGSAGANNSERTPGGSGGTGIVIARYKGATAGTGGTVSAGTGSSTGYTLQTFTSSATLTLNAMAPTLSGVISGSGGLSINATDGTVTFTGTNSYAGTTTISGGTVKVGNATSTGTLGEGAVTNNAALVFNRSNALTVANAMSGIGTLTQQGSGALTLTGGNSYDGTTTINSSTTLQIGDGSTSGTLGSGSVTDNGTLVFNRSDDVTVANAISGTGALTKAANNTLTLSANGAYSGATTVSAGTLVLQNNAPTKSTSGFSGPGVLRIEPLANDFSGAFSTSGWTFGSTLSGLTIGKASSSDGTTDVAVTIPSAISIAGPISIYGANVAINAALTATGTNTITLKGSGSITQTAALSATNLLLLGGNITLTNAGNAADTLAASGVGSLSYIDSNALTLGTVGATHGISASGAVSIGTKSLDLTVAQNLTTTDATSSALTLNAGIDTAAGTGTGGNIIVSGSPTISVGSGGIAKLYTGSVSGSTGLTAWLGLGSGRFRYYSDEAATNYTSALVSGLYGIYRERPATTVTLNASTMTYGDTLPTLGSTSSLVNGDTASFDITARANSSSGNIKYKSSAYAVTNTNLAALGYNVTGAAPGTLTVGQKALTLNGFDAANKEYNRSTTATIVSAGTLSGLIVGDTVTVANTGATFSDKNVGTAKTVTLNGVAISGTDVGNYSIAATATDTANITVKTLTLSGFDAANKEYDRSTTATIVSAGTLSGVIVGDTVSVANTGATFSDKNVGTAKTVTLNGVAISGTDVGNYSIAATATDTANITAKTLTLSGFDAANKEYDRSTTATIVSAGTLSGVIVGDAVTVANTGATFSDKNVGTAKTVTLNGVAISGTDVGNYSIAATATDTANITAKALTVSGLTASNKTYNANTVATLSGTATVTALSGDTVTLGGTAAGAFADKNVGTARSVTVTGVALSGAGADNGNYILLQQTGLTANIGKADLSVTGLIASIKTYDANTIASLTGSAAVTALGSDVVTLGGTAAGAFADKNVGTARSVTVTGVTLSGAGADNGNYNLLQQTGLSANISAKTVTLSASKTYDGSTSLAGFVTLGNLVGSETLTYSSATSSHAHVAAGSKFINAITLANAADGSGGLASNYQLPTLDAAHAPVTITAKALSATASIGGTLTKTYSGTTAATGASVSGTVTGGITGDTLTLDASALALNYNTARVVGASTITASGAAGFTVGASSASSVTSDYSFTSPTITSVAGSITAKTLTPTISNTGVTKTYDASTASAITPTYTLDGLVTGDTAATLSNSGLAYDSAHVVGASKVTVSGLAITGITGSKGSVTTDYVLSASTKDVAASITAAILTPTLTNTGITRTYNGTTSAPTGFTPGFSYSGFVSGDTGASLSNTGSVYNSKDVGSANKVTVSGLAITGVTGGINSLSSDYVLNATSKDAVASITAAPLTVIADNDARFFSQSDTAGYAGVSYSGFVNGETSGTAGLTGTLAMTRAGLTGSGSTDAAGSYVLTPSGVTAVNYAITHQAGTYTVAPAGQLLLKLSDVATTYGTAATYAVTSASYMTGTTVTTLTNPAAGNTVTLDGVTITLAPVSATTGTGGLLKVGSYQLGGTVTSGNTANFSNTLVVVGAQQVSAKALTASASGISKTYDGTTSMSGVTVGLAGKEANDVVTVSGSGAFATKDASATANIHYSVSGLVLSSADAGNYYLTGGSSFSGTNGSINARTVTLSASKTYDGSTSLAGFVTLGGLAGSETLTYSGAAANHANVAAGSKFISAITLANAADGSGGLAGNYQLPTLDAAHAPVTIAKALLSVTGLTASNKTYDGRTTATVISTAANLTGKIGSDDVTVASVTGNFADKNAGTAKAVNLTGITLGGVAAGNYELTSTSASASADITRLSSVTWAGGSSGNWFDPANWAGGAVPDLSNVANVVIPSGVTINFGGTVVSPAQSGAVNLDGLSGAGGSLSQSHGSLNVGTGGITLGSLTQSGGALTNTGLTTLRSFTQTGGSTVLSGALTVTQDFSQGTAGSVTVGGNTSLSDVGGGMQLGNLSSTGTLTVNSTDGAITQASGTSITAQGTSSVVAMQGASPADITWANQGNNFQGTVTLSGRNITLTDSNTLALGTAIATGDLLLNSSGALSLGTSSVGGNLSANSGNGDITQIGALTVAGDTTLLAGSGAVNLTHPGNRLTQAVRVVASSSSIAGDSRNSAADIQGKVQGSLPFATMPGAGMPTAAPQPLVLTQSVVSSGTAGSANSAGITIDLRQAPASTSSIMAAVSIPKGTASAGTGFSFELPQSIREMVGNGGAAQLSLADGAALPSWLIFNAQTLSFEAAAVPNGAFPLQLVLSIGGQRVMVTISERVE